MIFKVPINDAENLYPEYKFIKALSPSAQKASFHIQDAEGQDLCLKIISPKYQINRLQREILALQNIDHQNVAKLVEYVQTTKKGEQKHHIIEEYIDGYDLDEYLEKVSPDLDSKLDLFKEIFDGLEEAHTAEIVHRDLKPANIRVTHNGIPVIIDFGLARHLSLPSITQTKQGARIGTPKYFSPEQVTGTKYDIDSRTDIFALGVILYESVVGKHPFYDTSDSLSDLYDKILQSTDFLQEESFLDLPNLVQVLIKKMLEKDKIERLNSIDKANRLLKKIRE